MGALTQYISEYIDCGLNFDLGIFGSRGHGKSYAAMKLAEIISRRYQQPFTPDHIHFTADSFLPMIETMEDENQLHPGVCFIFDEAGIGMDSQTWYEENIKAVAGEMETYRTYNLLVIFTAPLVGNITKRARDMFTGYMKPDLPKVKDRQDLDRVATNIVKNEKVSKWRFYRLESESQPTKNKTITWNWNLKNSEGYLRSIRIKMPTVKLYHTYEKKKLEYLKEKRKGKIKKLEAQKQAGADAMDTEGIITAMLKKPGRYFKDWHGRKIIRKGIVKEDFNVGKHKIQNIKDLAEYQMNKEIKND